MEEERSTKIQKSLKKKIPPLSSFSLFELKRYDYVDKSILVASLMAHRETYLCIPSMRRCGKSFTLMLLKAMAEGQSDALSGLRICTDPNSAEWKLPTKGNAYHVIKLDFSLVHGYDDIAQAMAQYLRGKAKDAGVTIPEAQKVASQMLKYWIETVASGRNKIVVVLIDEYDYPLNPFLGDTEKLESILVELKAIFTILKGLSDALFKVIVTGGLKAGMSGLFSGANNFYALLDKEPEFSALFGFTADEIRGTYGMHIEEIFHPRSLDESMKSIAEYYNGYRFHPEDNQTYFNPWSTISYLHAKKLNRYWAHTCATQVVDKIIQHHGPEALAGVKFDLDELQRPMTTKDYTENWVSLFFQSGYLSIVGWENQANDVVRLGPPNREVREYLEKQIPRLLRIAAEPVGHWPNMVLYATAMSAFQFDEAAELLTKVLNGLRYDLLNENEFGGWVLHSLRLTDEFECIVTELSQRIDSDQGREKAKRLDGALIVKRNGTYSGIIVELKFNKNAQEALDQIRDREYVNRCEHFLQHRLRFRVERWYSVGFNLSTTPKKLVSCKHENRLAAPQQQQKHDKS